jgi:UDP:flavonoid glycosyltransferase YjiC (YdhE family)
MAADLLPVLAAWRPDGVVRDGVEYGACVAAERAGLPHATVLVGAAGPAPNQRELVAAPLEALRARHGLPPDPGFGMLYRYLALYPFPPSLRNPASALPPTAHAVRPALFDRSGDEGPPAWLAALPARPTVYATLGTVANDRADLFEAFIAGLRDEPGNLVVTVGRDQDPARFGPQPANVRVERYVPQSLLLARCDLVVSHGGSGTVVAALAHGLPLVVVPVTADQPYNAERCAALRLGRVLPPAEVTPGTVRAAVRAVRADPSYRRNAQRVRAEIDGMAGPEHAVALLERMVAARAPVIAPSA